MLQVELDVMTTSALDSSDQKGYIHEQLSKMEMCGMEYEILNDSRDCYSGCCKRQRRIRQMQMTESGGRRGFRAGGGRLAAIRAAAAETAVVAALAGRRNRPLSVVLRRTSYRQWTSSTSRPRQQLGGSGDDVKRKSWNRVSIQKRTWTFQISLL